MSKHEFRQDMPPKGGYGPINFTRMPAKTYFSGYALFGIYAGVTIGSFYLYHLNCQSVKKRELEQKSACFAIYPLLLAERDRELLKQVRRNREEERELMKNVEGWKVGTWYGEPVFHNQPANTFNMPRAQEFYVHADPKEFSKKFDIWLWS